MWARCLTHLIKPSTPIRDEINDLCTIHDLFFCLFAFKTTMQSRYGGLYVNCKRAKAALLGLSKSNLKMDYQLNTLQYTKVYDQPAKSLSHITDYFPIKAGQNQIFESSTHTAGLNMAFSEEYFCFDEGLADLFLGVPLKHLPADGLIQLSGDIRGIQTATATDPKQGRFVEQMVLIPPHQRYVLQTPNEAQSVMDYLYFKPTWLQGLATEFCDARIEEVNIQPDLLCDDRVLQSHAVAYLNHLKSAQGSQLMRDRLLHILGICLLQRKSIGLPKKRLRVNALPQRSFERVVEYIDTTLSQPIRLSELAAIVKLSEHHFLRSFKLATGMTPHQFLVEKRIERAELLLKKSHLPIAQIAADAGFASQSHMTQIFTARRGVTPFNYRFQN
jgi:AraC-like DNA-binding protein